MSTQFYDNQVATVDYQILFTKRDKEALLDSGRVVVTSAMAGSGFASWQISLFMEQLNRKAGGAGAPPAAGDGIPTPAAWTDDEAIEVAAEVFPVPPAPPVPGAILAAIAAAAAAGAAGNPVPAFPAAPAARAPITRVIGLKPENLKYLQVDYQIISAFDRKPPRYDADQVGVLREIASAIKNRP